MHAFFRSVTLQTAQQDSLSGVAYLIGLILSPGCMCMEAVFTYLHVPTYLAAERTHGRSLCLAYYHVDEPCELKFLTARKHDNASTCRPSLIHK